MHIILTTKYYFSIMEIWNTYFLPFVFLLEEMAPYLLLGFLIAGVLHAFVPQGTYRRYLSASNLRSVLCAILFGVPLPLCSCGVIPTAVGMRREGASRGATNAFLIATPQTGVDSILATYAILGLPFALLRPIVAMVTGLIGGVVTNAVDRDDDNADAATAGDDSDENAPTTFIEKCRSALSYGFTDMLIDIGQWLLLGIVLAGLITIFVPEGFFLSYQHNALLNMLIVLLIACPMYVCATGSIPVAAALMLKGLSSGAALVFLMAGPATNMASIMVLGKTLGRRSLMAYLLTIIVGAIAFGTIVDAFLPAEWFATVSHHAYHSACCHTEATPWWKVVCTVVFAILLVRALALRYIKGGASAAEPAAPEVRVTMLKVEGMMCNHCRAHVLDALTAVEGAQNVEVDLASGMARVEGDADVAALIAAVEKCGYRCQEQ